MDPIHRIALREYVGRINGEKDIRIAAYSIGEALRKLSDLVLDELDVITLKRWDRTEGDAK